jgi:hypothetical protein
LTEASRADCDEETGNYEEEVPGLVVLTQTCDLVRSCVERPFVEVAPLRQLEAEKWGSAARGRNPRYAVLPALAGAGWAADLDRVMTVEKAVVASWERIAGCTTDAEARTFALALARKRSRFAFPDDFVELVRPLQKRLIEKHDRGSDEGRALRALREIRVQASPSWDSASVELDFLFIRDDAARDFEGQPWNQLLGQWLGRVAANGRFGRVDGRVQTLDELTARDYVGSDVLDLGFLSDRAAL